MFADISGYPLLAEGDGANLTAEASQAMPVTGKAAGVAEPREPCLA